MKVLKYNISRDEFICNIQSKGFSIDKVATSSIPSEIEIQKGKDAFRNRSDISYVFDKEMDGRLVPERPSMSEPAFRQQTIDNVKEENINVLFKAGFNKIKE